MTKRAPKATSPAPPLPDWRRPAAVIVAVLAVGTVAGWVLARGPGSRLASTPVTSRTAVVSAPISTAAGATTMPGQTAREVAELRVQVLDTRPHDPGAFTQGLVWDAGRLFESTGLEGRSSLREVDPSSGQVRRQVDLAPDVFGEGLAMVDDRLVQITWQDGLAFDWRKDTFEKLGEFTYTGEGWGLCRDGDRLAMSDGSNRLFFRDPVTFRLEGQMKVTLNGESVFNLNELECVGNDIYANIWTTDWIYRIDKASGQVNAVIDAAGLLSAEESVGTDVLNGIAYKPETATFLITGKLWPKLFEVRFVQSTAALPFTLREVRRYRAVP